MDFDKYKEYSPTFVRFGVGIVFFLFGVNQLYAPKSWIAWIPSFVTEMINAKTFILLNGVFDILIGILLLLGLLLRITAIFGILHLLGVIIEIGWNDVAIRDFGLLLALIAVLLHGNDNWCLGRRIRKTA